MHVDVEASGACRHTGHPDSVAASVDSTWPVAVQES